MAHLRSSLVSAVVLTATLAPAAAARGAATQAFAVEILKPVALDVLGRAARERVRATARVPLTPVTADLFRDVTTLEPRGSGRVPNYLRALSALPQSVRPFSELVKSVLYDGAIQPEIKMAMGLRIAQINDSPYAAAHLQRFLNGTEHGRALVRQMAAGDQPRLKPAERLALRYAESLTTDIHGVTDEDFRAVRSSFNDGQVVELTLTVSFFNYFTRLVEALNLPVEPWALDTPFTPAHGSFEAPAARVNLVSDRQMEWARSIARPQGAGSTAAARGAGDQPRGGFALANSQRAMMLSPEIAMAWRRVFASAGDQVVSRELKLHVSFAVSEANGCRYCTLHQVQGLRRLGVDMSKLMQMKKDDSALAPRELTAVTFARTLTRNPSSITDADYQTLRSAFTDQGALEIVLQTCNFAFMNRFTDGLRLPSEDEAVRVYREVYGSDFQPSPIRTVR